MAACQIFDQFIALAFARHFEQVAVIGDDSHGLCSIIFVGMNDATLHWVFPNSAQ